MGLLVDVITGFAKPDSSLCMSLRANGVMIRTVPLVASHEVATTELRNCC